MRLHLPGEPSVTLTRADFVAQGGEGAVYARAGHAYKVWLDPARTMPEAKLRALMALDIPGVVRPTAPLLDDAGRIAGFRMDHLTGTWPLCRLVPSAFRTRHGLSDRQLMALLVALRKTIAAVHARGALIVDLNELNVLVSRDFARPYLIDVDSWQAGGFPATALLPGVRDFGAPEGQFTELTDWYAFGVLAFLLLCGVHPYKGKHATLKGLQARATARVPVWHTSVTAPPSMRGLDAVPDEWRAWFGALFERGERLPPPSEAGAQPAPKPVVRRSTGGLHIDVIRSFGGPVLGVRERLGTSVVWTTDALWVDGHRSAALPPGFVDVVFSPRRNVPVAAALHGGRLHLLDLHTRAPVPIQLHADDAMHTDGRLVVRTGEHLMELTLLDGGPAVLATAAIVARVLPHATQLFPGVAIQDLLGTAWASVFPAPGQHVQLRLPDLDGLTVVDAAAQRGVMVVSGVSGGEWQRLTVRYDTRNVRKARWDVRVDGTPGPAPVSFTVLETGVAVLMDEAGSLRLFSNRVGSAGHKVVDDPGIDPGWDLRQRQGRVVVARGDELVRVGLG